MAGPRTIWRRPGWPPKPAPLLHTGRLLLGVAEPASSWRPASALCAEVGGAGGSRSVRRPSPPLAIVGVGLLWRRNSQQEAGNTASSTLRLAELALRAGSDRPDLGLRPRRSGARSGRSARGPLGPRHRAVAARSARGSVGPPTPTGGHRRRPRPRPGPAAGRHGGRRPPQLRGHLPLRARRGSSHRSPARCARSAPRENTVAIILGDGSVVAGGLDGPLQSCRPEVEARVASLAPNGGLVAVGTSDGAIEVRNLAGSGGPVGRVAGVPSAVAVGSGLDVVLGAGSARAGFTLWDISGRPLADIFLGRGHRGGAGRRHRRGFGSGDRERRFRRRHSDLVTGGAAGGLSRRAATANRATSVPSWASPSRAISWCLSMRAVSSASGICGPFDRSARR